jgi:hypothetical protein
MEPPPLIAVAVAHHRWRGRKEVSRCSAFVRSVPLRRKEAAAAVIWSRVAITRGANGTLGGGSRLAVGGGTEGRCNPSRWRPVDGVGAQSSPMVRGLEAASGAVGWSAHPPSSTPPVCSRHCRSSKGGGQGCEDADTELVHSRRCPS